MGDRIFALDGLERAILELFSEILFKDLAIRLVNVAEADKAAWLKGETITVVGDHDPALMKYFDCTRSGPRSAFDSNVVYQFEIMEYILDFGFDRLGADQPQINHPVLVTECPCNPIQSRSKMAELLFESYGVPSVAFGVDAAFSYKYNQHLGICSNDGLAICSGFNTSHAIPFLNGEPVYEACCRTNVGGYHITDYLKQLLSLKYPHHMSKLTWEKVEELKMEHCYIAPDYLSEVRLFQKGGEKAEEKTRCWQLPWTPAPVEEAPSEEEIARKAALREKQGQRLREMAEAKRFNRINDLENEIGELEMLLQRLSHATEDDVPSILARTVYASKKDLESALAKAALSLRKAKGEPIEVVEKMDVSLSEKYNLINVPDDMLTPEQLKQKKKQIFIKSTSEARLQKKQKQAEEEIERERKRKLEEERRLENPERYLEEMRAKHRDLSDKIEQRKRLKTNGGHNNGYHNASGGGVGRGERLNSSQRERMRLLTTAAFDRGKGEDTFGAKDEDWQLYKLMSRDNDDDEDDKPDPDEAELARISSRLQEIDPTFIFKAEAGSSSAEAPRFRPLTKEDFQIILGVERFRCTEVLFNPNLIGIEQAGVDEMAGISIRRLPAKYQGQGVEERITSSILVTGGSSVFPGMQRRLEAGIRAIRPCGAPIKIFQASDPILDAWRGASVYAAAAQFERQTFSRMDYYEKGEDLLRNYQLAYTII
ncbi:actin-related protein 5 isoform X2 [Andrographis paniculata]|uniref:actin-related protein 5 isoform X2 n=1 Tax=Andrographis paniculata TaxID=175694 RepID=UPI0021E96DA7|nr:actin-related protein 5 isoform X2 [Andrographis paniculata]